jgi:hypothetical protein
LVSGRQPAGAAEAGGVTTAAGVVAAGLDGVGVDGAGFAGTGFVGTGVVGTGVGGGAGARGAAEVVSVLTGCVFCTAAAACVVRGPGAPVAVAEAVVVLPAVVPLPGDECDPPRFAATTTMISPTKASNPVSALCRAGQDCPRRGGCGGR